MNNFWSNEGIEATDIERLKELTADDKIKAGVYSESTTERENRTRKANKLFSDPVFIYIYIY